jgi:FkbM family methyltransferase
LAKLLERAREDEVLREQSERIAAHAEQHGWELSTVYRDGPGDTVGPGRRAGLDALIEDLKGLDKVVVVSLDRLLPGVEAAVDLLEKFSSAGVDLVSLDERFDAGEPTGDSAAAVLRLARVWQRRAAWRQAWGAESLRKPGFSPATMIDVGAAEGTPPLYEAFPAAHHVLIDPLEEYREALEELSARVGGEYHRVAVGAEEGELVIHVRARHLQASSMRHDPEARQKQEPRTIRVTTLDALRDEHAWQPPFGLKIDTEGYEDEVLKGATRLLADTQFVVAEVRVKPLFDGGYTFAELIGLLDRHGFRLCDVMTSPKAPGEDETLYMDAVFRRDGPPTAT